MLTAGKTSPSKFLAVSVVIVMAYYVPPYKGIYGDIVTVKYTVFATEDVQGWTYLLIVQTIVTT